MKRIDGFLIFLITLLLGACPQARAEPNVEISGTTGFGALVAGVTSGRFALSPSASLSVRDERWFFVARDTVSFLGATGGRLCGQVSGLAPGVGVRPFTTHVRAQRSVARGRSPC